MGKLFWKFFLFLWLGQLITTMGVGIAIWLIEPNRGEPVAEAPPTASSAKPEFPPMPPQMDRSMEPTPLPPASPADSRPGGMPGMALEPPPSGFENGREPPLSLPEHTVSAPVLPLLAGSLVSLLFAALLAWYFARPIRTLGQAFESVANGRLETRVGQAMGNRHDELADLGSGFDSMAERLQGLVEGKQRLLHDVSHELRSPLARLQAATDLMQQQPERTAEFIDRIERESGRINRLVGELLTLARLDAGIPGNRMLSIDLNELIEAIAEDARFEAETKQCRVVVSMPEKGFVRGTPELLHRAIENIVRNALRHTPDGSQISITTQVDREQQRLSIDIMDEGKGVPEAEIQSLFEPFFRSPTANRFTGYGMGMAITRRVVDVHHGKVSAKNRTDGGLIVTIELPMAD